MSALAVRLLPPTETEVLKAAQGGWGQALLPSMDEAVKEAESEMRAALAHPAGAADAGDAGGEAGGHNDDAAAPPPVHDRDRGDAMPMHDHASPRPGRVALDDVLAQMHGQPAAAAAVIADDVLATFTRSGQAQQRRQDGQEQQQQQQQNHRRHPPQSNYPAEAGGGSKGGAALYPDNAIAAEIIRMEQWSRVIYIAEHVGGPKFAGAMRLNVK